MDAHLILSGFVLLLCLCAANIDGACVAQDDCTGHYNCSADLKQCLTGWDGPDCTIPSPPVTSADNTGACPRSDLQDCKNGGGCFNGDCCCLAGYEGEICGTDTNECDSNPCMNGGSCVDGVNGYTCACADSTVARGPRCEVLPTTTVPTTTTSSATTAAEDDDEDEDFLTRLRNLEMEYAVMLGMGLMIVLLVITVVVIICIMPQKRNSVDKV